MWQDEEDQRPSFTHVFRALQTWADNAEETAL